jgi:hypothetical protein
MHGDRTWKTRSNAFLRSTEDAVDWTDGCAGWPRCSTPTTTSAGREPDARRNATPGCRPGPVVGSGRQSAQVKRPQALRAHPGAARVDGGARARTEGGRSDPAGREPDAKLSAVWGHVSARAGQPSVLYGSVSQTVVSLAKCGVAFYGQTGYGVARASEDSGARVSGDGSARLVDQLLRPRALRWVHSDGRMAVIAWSQSGGDEVSEGGSVGGV